MRRIRRVPQYSVVLPEDEPDLLLFPPLRAMWSLRGVPAQVLSGWNARRTVFGCINLATGQCLFQVRYRQRAEDFQAFLRQVHRRYRVACDLAVGQRLQVYGHHVAGPGS